MPIPPLSDSVPRLRSVLPALQVAVAAGAVWFIADALYEDRADPEIYTIQALAPDPEPPADASSSFDGLAGCSGYVPALPTDDCDGPPVPSNNAVPPAAAGSPEEEDDDGAPIPFASTETDTGETLAPPTVTENGDGTKTVELAGLSAAGADPTEPVNTVTFTGTADEGVWNPGLSFEVPGTDIVLVPADISAASTNSGGLEASVFGFETVVSSAEEEDGVSVAFEGIVFEGEWDEDATCYACIGETPPEGANDSGTLSAGGVFENPDGELVLVPGTGSDSSEASDSEEEDPPSEDPASEDSASEDSASEDEDPASEDASPASEIVFSDIPDGATYLATLIDLENDGVFDVAFIAPEGGIEIDLDDPAG